MMVVLFSRFRSEIYFLLMALVFAWAVQLPAPEGLDTDAWRSLCVFGLCVFLWVTTLIPLAITGLLAIALIPILGIQSEALTYSYFGSKAVFFILGAFTLGAAVVGCGLSTRVTTWALRRFGSSPQQLVTTIFVFTAGASCVMSEHAVAAMCFPVVLEVVRSLQLPRGKSRFAKAMFFALAWGCIIGGTATILGGGRAPLAIGILEQSPVLSEPTTISFLEYMVLDLPLVLLLFCVGYVMLRVTLKPEIDTIAPALEALERRMGDLGKITLREKLVALAMVITIACWVIAGEEFGLANIAMLSTTALFVFKLVTWRDVEANVNWGVILMYGGAITLGSVLAETGAATWMTELLVGNWQGSPESLLMAMGLLTVILTEFMSNSAVIAILMAPGLSLAVANGIDPRIMTMAIVLPSNFAFMFPMATPATALAYSSGTFSPREAIARGALLDLMGLVLLAVLVYGYWPMVMSLGWG